MPGCLLDFVADPLALHPFVCFDQQQRTWVFIKPTDGCGRFRPDQPRGGAAGHGSARKRTQRVEQSDGSTGPLAKELWPLPTGPALRANVSN